MLANAVARYANVLHNNKSFDVEGAVEAILHKSRIVVFTGGKMSDTFNMPTGGYFE